MKMNMKLSKIMSFKNMSNYAVRKCNFADDVDCILDATHVGLFIDNHQRGYACDLHVCRLESVACLK